MQNDPSMVHLNTGVLGAVLIFGMRRGSDLTLLSHDVVSFTIFVAELERLRCRLLKNHCRSLPTCFAMMATSGAWISFTK